jgi:hypothetical protein
MDVPVVIYCDNISSILLVNNPVYHARTKHIEVHYHFIRKKVLAKEIDLIHVSTKDYVADIFTKALGTRQVKGISTNAWCTRSGFELEGEC